MKQQIEAPRKPYTHGHDFVGPVNQRSCSYCQAREGTAEARSLCPVPDTKRRV